MTIPIPPRARRTVVALSSILVLTGTALLAGPVNPASAQPGSRVCGYFWTHTTVDGNGSFQEIVARVAEVPKSGALAQCWRAQNSYRYLPNDTELSQALGEPPRHVRRLPGVSPQPTA